MAKQPVTPVTRTAPPPPTVQGGPPHLSPRGNGNGFAPALSPAPLGAWPIPGDAPDLRTIVQAQAETIEEQEALLHAYQLTLSAALNPLPGTAAIGTGTATGNQLNVTAVTGTIVNGATVSDGVTVPSGTTILGQISGTTGGAGLYLTSAATTAAGTALTFTPPPPPSSWPTPTDAPTLNLIAQNQTAVIRVQTALMQHYQDLLNNSQTAPPPTGP